MHGKILAGLAMLALTACAADRVRPAAKETGLQTTALVGDLSRFAETSKRWTDFQRTQISNLQQATAMRAADAERDKATLRIANARDDAAASQILEEFGATVDRMAATKPAPPPEVALPELPVQALAGLAKALADIDKPQDRAAALGFLVEHARRIHEQITALEKVAP
jgi:hypothetical protein